MSFLNHVSVREDGPKGWRLNGPLVYRGSRDVFLVPSSFSTDFASVPQVFMWLVPSTGIHTKAAVLHDYLCRGDEVTREDADGIFRRVLREEGVSFPLRWAMWAAVRAGSFMKGASGTSWLRFLAVLVVAVPFLLVPAVIVGLWSLAFRVMGG